MAAALWAWVNNQGRDLLVLCSCLPSGEEPGAVFPLVTKFRISNCSWKGEAANELWTVFAKWSILFEPFGRFLTAKFLYVQCFCNHDWLSSLSPKASSSLLFFLASLLFILPPTGIFIFIASALITIVFTYCRCWSLNPTHLRHFNILML